MFCVIETSLARLCLRYATLAVITIGISACSSLSSRFNENDPEATGVPQPRQAAPIGRVDGTAPPSQNTSPTTFLAPKLASSATLSRGGTAEMHVVAQGETLGRISRLYSKPIREIARANKILATAKLNVGDRLIIPPAYISAAKQMATPAAERQSKQVAVPEAASKKSELGFVYTPAPKPETPSAKEPSRPRDEVPGRFSKLRWPATGRVIAGFGPAANGQPNNGINIALPENTPVKAAEDGVVTYAGNELTAYGNLVQVRHPNGYSTVYAHVKELLVKRGDPVKRGQPIARSGQTGNVNAPQLHFQVRKGASPLDPMKFLNGA
jgi:murein DD-endopeptidase MepM/ murein hydrolase activator NlpD